MVILKFVLVARDQPDREPGGAGDRDVVGGVARAGAVRGEDRGEAEALRRLRPPEPVARRRRPARPSVAAPERVDHGQRGQGGRGGVEGVEDGRDQRRAQERPGGIVDQHPVGRVGAPAPRGRRAPRRRGWRRLRPAGRRRGSAMAGDGGVVERPVMGVDHHLRPGRWLGERAAASTACRRTAQAPRGGTAWASARRAGCLALPPRSSPLSASPPPGFAAAGHIAGRASPPTIRRRTSRLSPLPHCGRQSPCLRTGWAHVC